MIKRFARWILRDEISLLRAKIDLYREKIAKLEATFQCPGGGTGRRS